MHINQDPIKQITLKLSVLSWWDRYKILRQLDGAQALQIKQGLKELKKLGIQNKPDLIHQLAQKNAEKVTQPTQQRPLSDGLRSHLDAEFNMAQSTLATETKRYLMQVLTKENGHG
ncbi:hypothetical protein L1286_22335 [Pseudoalteromonas sp. SMS1]|uniref:hypothetical protein n=1 Tax=Pseudoalteromonas sp. SMS1 TaxID=2908894 RepID=UPI001F3EC498|nr:hypothetical protein [Pseudoalteromonas sp. SMS1]MCF2860223.1 hypothetical protein [Pseudoalteromonas sp. SMS1]